MILTYLATPYTHPDPTVRAYRFRMVNKVAAEMLARHEYVYSPISHTHPIALAGNLPKDWGFWVGFGETMLRKCDRLLVLRLSGWDQSQGVSAEIHIANSIGIPVDYMDPPHA